MGNEITCYEQGWTWNIVVTKNFYDSFNKNYVENGQTPFINWKEQGFYIEAKFLYRLNFIDVDAENLFGLSPFD